MVTEITSQVLSNFLYLRCVHLIERRLLSVRVPSPAPATPKWMLNLLPLMRHVPRRRILLKVVFHVLSGFRKLSRAHAIWIPPRAATEWTLTFLGKPEFDVYDRVVATSRLAKRRDSTRHCGLMPIFVILLACTRSNNAKRVARELLPSSQGSRIWVPMANNTDANVQQPLAALLLRCTQRPR